MAANMNTHFLSLFLFHFAIPRILSGFPGAHNTQHTTELVRLSGSDFVQTIR